MEGPVMEESDTEISEDGSGSSSTWTETGSLPTAAGSYVLGNDILLERYWVVDADISLDLNGHTIDRGLKGKNAEYDGCVIFMGNRGRFSIPTIPKDKSRQWESRNLSP